MLIWTGFALIVLGFASFAIDRRAAHVFHAIVDRRVEHVLHATTDWAKGAHWLVAAALTYGLARALAWKFGPDATLETLRQASLSFLASLAAASIILHAIKMLFGRRRPRDELELNLYGFRPLVFDLRSDSFPSGHALTIFCVAVVLSAALPSLAPLWFAIAVYLAMTRALLNSHFLSDVLVGAGIALVCTREILLTVFPTLVRPWF